MKGFECFLNQSKMLFPADHDNTLGSTVSYCNYWPCHSHIPNPKTVHSLCSSVHCVLPPTSYFLLDFYLEAVMTLMRTTERHNSESHNWTIRQQGLDEVNWAIVGEATAFFDIGNICICIFIHVYTHTQYSNIFILGKWDHWGDCVCRVHCTQNIQERSRNSMIIII